MKIEVNCSNCNIAFSKSKSEMKKTINHFCSRSCSAIFNNKKYPKRPHNTNCILCRKRTNKSTAKYCDDCRPNYSSIPISEQTLEEVINSLSRTKYSYIRRKARLQTKNLEQKCKNCGYDKHTEVCHIKSISSFDKKTKISEINNPNNLILLCPNCHWEFDNNLLNLPSADPDTASRS